MKEQKSEIKEVELSKLVPFEKNPNIHPQEQVDALSKSIETYSQYYPIICDEEYHILCGHGKLMALQQLGKKVGEVRILHGLTKKQKLKLVIEDNKVQSLGYVNYSKIEDIIREVGETDIIGFDTDYLEGVINESVPDNMGVDFTKPLNAKSNKEQVEKIPQEKQESQDDERESFEEGMQKPRVIICPHCGKEIVL